MEKYFRSTGEWLINGQETDNSAESSFKNRL